MASSPRLNCYFLYLRQQKLKTTCIEPVLMIVLPHCFTRGSVRNREKPNMEGALENSIQLDAEGVRCVCAESLRQKNEAASEIIVCTPSYT